MYTAVLAQAALGRGDAVTLAMPPGSQDTADFRTHLSHLQGRVKFVELPERVSVRYLSKLRQNQFSLIVVPNGDRLAMSLGLRPLLRRGSTLSLLVMSDPRLAPAKSFGRLSKLWLKLALIKAAERKRGIEIAWLRGPGAAVSVSERVALDPVIVEQDLDIIDAEIKASLGGLSGRYWFGVTGVISPWKNLPLVLTAFEELSDPDSGLLIAGPIAPEVKRSIQLQIERLVEKGASVVVIDRLLTNAEMNLVIRFLDAVVLAYSTHAPNSTLGKAAALGTRVIAAGSDAFLSHARRAEVGALTSALTVRELRRSMNEALQLPRPRKRSDLGIQQFSDTLLLSESAEQG